MLFIFCSWKLLTFSFQIFRLLINKVVKYVDCCTFFFTIYLVFLAINFCYISVSWFGWMARRRFSSRWATWQSSRRHRCIVAFRIHYSFCTSADKILFLRCLPNLFINKEMHWELCINRLIITENTVFDKISEDGNIVEIY